MPLYRVGELVKFGGYINHLEGVPPIFDPGDVVVLLTSGPEGIYRCARDDYHGRSIATLTDVLFEEELLAMATRCHSRCNWLQV